MNQVLNKASAVLFIHGLAEFSSFWRGICKWKRTRTLPLDSKANHVENIVRLNALVSLMSIASHPDWNADSTRLVR